MPDLRLSNYFSVLSKILDTFATWLKKIPCLPSSSKRYMLRTGAADCKRFIFLFPSTGALSLHPNSAILLSQVRGAIDYSVFCISR